MPLYKTINFSPTIQILVWKITETFDDLFDQVVLNDINMIRLKNMKSELHQRGFLSVRKLLHRNAKRKNSPNRRQICRL
jgi:4'-phosphopantetheinyl transferase